MEESILEEPLRSLLHILEAVIIYLEEVLSRRERLHHLVSRSIRDDFVEELLEILDIFDVHVDVMVVGLH